MNNDHNNQEVRKCVECGNEFTCHKESGFVFCGICNYLAEFENE